MTYVKDLMESGIKNIDREATLEEAAKIMKDVDCGFLPVGSDNRAEGIITDRDIVIRAVAEGRDPSSVTVEECMSKKICSIDEDASLEDAARKMYENRVSRLVVTDVSGDLCGILTFGRILRQDQDLSEINNVVSFATGKAA